jgi:hypothetical protein
MTYKPLTLKADAAVPGRKHGTVVSHFTDAEDGVDGTVHTVTTQRKSQGLRGRDRHAVYVDGKLAGVLYVEGIGRWSVHSYGADSKPSEHRDRNGYLYQPRGYAETGTLARNIERVVFEYLNAVDYARRKAAKA